MADWKSRFHSILASYFISFIEQKRAFGYKYTNEFYPLSRLDRFLREKKLRKVELPKDLVEKWIERTEMQTPRTQQLRVICVRNFAKYLVEQGIPAYVPTIYDTEKKTSDFKPYIFSRDEITQLFKAADMYSLEPSRGCYALFFRVIIRLLYATGCRAGEIASLRWRDVDLQNGVLKIYDAKYRRDRIVPLASGTWKYMEQYALEQESRLPEQYVFHGSCGYAGEQCTVATMYVWFRKLLFRCGISHGGRGKGPRLHDLRHTFAVHNLERWLKAEENPMDKLPILADYLGHQSMMATQHYLRLIPSIHEEIASRMEEAIGSKIKRKETNDETN